MVLDGEQHETLRVLLQEGLISLLSLDTGRYNSLGLLLRFLCCGCIGVDLAGEGVDIGVERRVLFGRSGKV